jgi:hypothetical protein
MNDTVMDEVLLKLEQTGKESEEELENITRTLVNELKHVEGIHNVSYVSKQEKIPEGARAGEMINLGEIVLSFITTGGLVAAINVVNSWLQNKKRKVKFQTKNGTIEADNLSKEEVDKIIDLVKTTGK